MDDNDIALLQIQEQLHIMMSGEDDVPQVSVDYQDCTVKRKITSLRREWYKLDTNFNQYNETIDDQAARHMWHDSGIGSTPSDDAGMMQVSSTSSDYGSVFTDAGERPQNDIKPVRHVRIEAAPEEKSNLAAYLQSEAEASQHFVDDITSTVTMRRRRHALDELTIRRRSRKARDSIESYQPTAPPESKWGAMFDEMIARLRGYPDERITDCVDHEHSHEQPSAELAIDIEESKRQILQEEMDYYEDEEMGTKLQWCHFDKIEDFDNNTDMTPMQPDTVEVQHEVETTVENNIIYAEQKSDCQSAAPASSQGSRPNSYFSQESATTPTQSDENKALLRSISFRRPELASYTLPSPPLRRTESNNDVWIERLKEQVEPEEQRLTSKKAIYSQNQSSTWTKFKKIFPMFKTAA